MGCKIQYACAYTIYPNKMELILFAMSSNGMKDQIKANRGRAKIKTTQKHFKMA